MSGPIVRSGPSPEFSKNWDSVFGKKSKSAAPVAEPKPAGKAAKKAAPKKAASPKKKASSKKKAKK